MAPGHHSIVSTPAASAGGGGGTGGGTGSGATDIPGWTLLMDEGFDTPAAEGQFLSKYPNMTAYDNGTPDTWAQAHGGGSQYRTDNISVANSIMTVRVYANSSGSYGAAILPILPGASAYHGRLYMRRSVRARCINPVSWQKIAYEFWPDSDQWNDGEIDFPEMDLDGTLGGHNHWPGNPTSQDNYDGTATLATWHEYVTEWSPNLIKWILDGTTVKTITNHVPNTSMHDILQCERILSASPAPVAGQSCQVQTDWVRYWRPS